MATLELPYEKVYDLLHKCCTSISPDVLYLMKRAASKETNPEAKTFLETMLRNVELAGQMDKPVCQSPGFPSVWIRWGEAMQPNLTNLMGNITQSVIEATKAGYIRPSIVHPLTRHNPGDSSGRGVPNYELRYEKDLPYCEIIVSAKGCGAELPNVAKILTPATLGKNYKGLKQLVLDTICGSNGFMGARGYPCPPFSIGIGLGGQMDVWRPSSLVKPFRPATGSITTLIRSLMNLNRNSSQTSTSSRTVPLVSAAIQPLWR